MYKKVKFGTKAYSAPGISPNRFAPAQTNKRASHFILSKTTKGGACFFIALIPNLLSDEQSEER
jgi:hypothetical protein